MSMSWTGLQGRVSAPCSKKSFNTHCKWPCNLSGPIYRLCTCSVMLTACAPVSQRALHKIVDTWDTDTYHFRWIFILFLLVDNPPNEFKPVLLCNCALQNLVWFWKLTPIWLSLDFFQWKNYRSDFKISRHVSKEWFFITDRNSQNLR